MQLGNGEKSRFWSRLPKGSGFYLVLALTVLAAGVGVWGSVNNSLRRNPFTSAEITAPSTINWGNYVTRPVIEEFTQQVAEPVKNVPDSRSEVTSAKETATKPENAPYTGNFTLPFGTKIVKDYSGGEMVKSATMGDWRVHNGVDFAGASDAPVVAIQAGTVKGVAQDPMWGTVVTIDHGQGVVARYCGIAESSAPKEGRQVSRGEQLGIIAQVPCESAEGTHLHFEVLVGGKVADPLAVMNRAG